MKKFILTKDGKDIIDLTDVMDYKDISLLTRALGQSDYGFDIEWKDSINDNKPDLDPDFGGYNRQTIIEYLPADISLMSLRTYLREHDSVLQHINPSFISIMDSNKEGIKKVLWSDVRRWIDEWAGLAIEFRGVVYHVRWATDRIRLAHALDKNAQSFERGIILSDSDYFYTWTEIIKKIESGQWK